ncbi:TPA: hypothetical protein N0F65_009337 [Lagenidium giganteum]|uniref:Tyrosinase copper-binding domain-containing protein n=1 Tax=Lagenidium giganteum TaxID=4803 RepID=A0AAV2YL68_9STRA|nr:TPA: hypothetical protein N0F65_009337 [Lagenidium giganteum]
MDRGLHIKFIQMHTEYFSELEAHRQCMFIYWHRRFLLGYENMLRSLGKTYECVTIPVWDHLNHKCGQWGKSVNLMIYNQTIDLPDGGACITRGSPFNDYPGDAYLSSVMAQIFPPSWKWIDFANGIERGVHNTVHGYIDGVMSYFESPADPLFYTHHAFVDAAQTIYLKCAFQITNNRKLTVQEKVSDKVWQSCERRPQNSGKFFQPNDVITMRVTDTNGRWVDVNTQGNTLYTYFKDLPRTFGEYIDAKDLGVYSYTYSFSPNSNLYILWDKCQNAPNVRSLSPSLLAEDKDHSWEDLKPVWKGKSTCPSRVHKWNVAIYSAAVLSGYTEVAAREMLEIITCVHKNECISPTQDYAPVFRRNFGVMGHSRCYTLLDMLRKGDKVIGVPHWREITEKFLPCPRKEGLVAYTQDDTDDTDASVVM